MGINRVQFQKGLSMAEFMERYGTASQTCGRLHRRCAAYIKLGTF
jgi:hypothetical protein